MVFRHLIKLCFLVLGCILPLAANSANDEVMGEKRKKVAMRMVGHKVLQCLGDTESRILPIQKIDEYYKIPFKLEFGFDPAEIIFIIDEVMTQAKIASNYFVEVEQCKTKEIVYGFEVNSMVRVGLVPCEGRILPKDCYSFLITILDNTSPITASTGDSPLTFLGATKTNLLKVVLIMTLLLCLIGFVYFTKKKTPKEFDPNLISIGAFQFDKNNMILSFENNSVDLSNKEAELLSLLHAFANKSLEREVILQRVWGDEGDYIGRTLDVFISKLRKKLEADSSIKIVNIRGIGYKLILNAS